MFHLSSLFWNVPWPVHRCSSIALGTGWSFSIDRKLLHRIVWFIPSPYFSLFTHSWIPFQILDPVDLFANIDKIFSQLVFSLSVPRQGHFLTLLSNPLIEVYISVLTSLIPKHLLSEQFSFVTSCLLDVISSLISWSIWIACFLLFFVYFSLNHTNPCSFRFNSHSPY